MPGKKVFDTDSYLTELDTLVASSLPDKRGVWYSFRETLFYPQGGGQSSDRGWINSNEVLEVKFSEDEVWHLLKSSVTESVSMKLDWGHRYLNMQQHTGQHILSACFKEFHNLDTLSVHLGTDITMIELDTPAVEEGVLENIESSANLIIRENLPVHSIQTDRSGLDTYKLRRKIKTENNKIRLVQIGDFDCVGCGGTHVRSTAEVGLIKIIGAEKIRGHARIKIKIGEAAYQYYHELHQTLYYVNTQLTTSLEDLPERIDLLVNEKKELINEKKHLTELWLSEYAKSLVDEEISGCFTVKDLDKEQLKILSEFYLVRYQLPCLFISLESERIHFYIRTPIELDINVQDFIEKFKSQYSLKGGGGRDFAVGQIDTKNRSHFSQEQLFHSFKEFINERSDK
jgi:alanyl-tRNA synthetase